MQSRLREAALDALVRIHVQFAQAGTTTAQISADARNSDKPGTDPTPEDFSVPDSLLEVDTTDGLGKTLVPEGLEFSLNTDHDHSGANNGNDKRTTKFTFLADDFATTAVITDEGVADPFFACPPGLKCPTGGWTEAIIPGKSGNPLLIENPGPFFASPNLLRIELTYDASTLPSNLTTKNYVLLHDKDYDPTTTNYEQIDDRCTGAHPVPPCLEEVRFLTGGDQEGDLYVRARVDGNHRYR